MTDGLGKPKHTVGKNVRDEGFCPVHLSEVGSALGEYFWSSASDICWAEPPEGEVPPPRDTAPACDPSHAAPKGCGQEPLVVVAVASFQKGSSHAHWLEQ